jgi:NTP pyrophosphatase (non-canonical NTP hydrolase)
MVHSLAVSKGWWGELDAQGELPPLTTDEVLAKLMLVVTEIAEAVEEARRVPVERLAESRIENGKPEGFAVELGDAVIRILDLAGRLEIDLETEMVRKHSYNETRAHRHGGRLA